MPPMSSVLSGGGSVVLLLGVPFSVVEEILAKKGPKDSRSQGT